MYSYNHVSGARRFVYRSVARAGHVLLAIVVLRRRLLLYTV